MRSGCDKLFAPPLSEMHITAVLSLLIPILLQLSIFIILTERSLQHRFRWFLTYLIYDFLNAFIRLTFSGNQYRYFIVYWVTSAIGVPFTFFAIRESFMRPLRPFFTRKLWRIFWICLGFAGLYSTAKAFLQPSMRAPIF